MNIFNLFKKKEKKSVLTQNTPTNTSRSSFSKEEKYEMSRELLKQATSLKKENIEQSIILIKNAIKMSPEKVLSDNFKLASYLFLANRKEEAYAIHYNLLKGFDKMDIGMFNMNKSQVYDKLCILSYKDKNYLKYLECFSLWIYNTAIAFTSQGRIDELSNLLNSENKLIFLAPTKVNGSFKKLGKEDKMTEFNIIISEYLNNKREILTKMAKKAREIDYSNDNDNYELEETFGERSNRLLQIEKNFMSEYDQLNTNQFLLYFESKLRPLLI